MNDVTYEVQKTLIKKKIPGQDIERYPCCATREP